MHFHSRTKFEISGRFAGFIRNREGKRRMLLQIGDAEPIALKLAKDLRKAFEPRLTPGVQIAVLGIEYRDFGDESEHVVSHLRILPTTKVSNLDPCVRCPIKVCAKKNCWKNGGAELFERLEARLQDAGLDGAVKVKAVGCLDYCKCGPSVEVGKKVFERCDPDRIDKILEYVNQQLIERSVG